MRREGDCGRETGLGEGEGRVLSVFLKKRCQELLQQFISLNVVLTSHS